MRARWLGIILLTISAPLAQAAIEYVTPDQIQSLHKQFSAAKSPGSELANTVLQGRWRCDLYGVRSRLQIERNLELYVFGAGEVLKNQGAQVVREYSWTKDGVVGKRGNIQDSLRIFGTNQLISRLEILGVDKSAQADRAVLAYGVCRRA